MEYSCNVCDGTRIVGGCAPCHHCAAFDSVGISNILSNNWIDCTPPDTLPFPKPDTLPFPKPGAPDLLQHNPISHILQPPNPIQLNLPSKNDCTPQQQILTNSNVAMGAMVPFPPDLAIPHHIVLPKTILKNPITFV